MSITCKFNIVFLCTCSFIKKNTREFDVQCSVSGRAYHISDPLAGAQMWADLINAVLQEKRSASSVSLNLRINSLAR